jgi:7-cyano-7-deazaguanine synthase in queuosine biosynthesis
MLHLPGSSPAMARSQFAPEAQGRFTVDLTDNVQVNALGLAHKDLARDPWYSLEEAYLCTPAGHPIPVQVADLLDVCSQVTLLDRICRRPRRVRRARFGIQRGWARRFTVTLGVREPHRWNAPAVRGKLEHLLQWMTEDEWSTTFRFAERRKVVPIRQAGLLAPRLGAQVVLFSGGLDSLAGTVALLEETTHDVVLVGVTHDRLRGVILKQMGALQQHYGPERVHLGHIPFELSHMPRHDEYTQRTRAFRFLSCGAAQAVACGLTDIVVCENGVGCLNLPYNWRQLGAQHTRSTHPVTLVEMTALLQALDLGALRCVAPFQFQTKAEVCRSLSATSLSNLVANTVSCDSFAFREPIGERGEELHCGTCTSCLLRRQALYAAALERFESPERYRFDVRFPPDPLHPERIFPLQMMLDQVTSIEQCGQSEQAVTACVQEFPELRTAAYAIAQDPAAFGVAAATSSRDILAGLCDLLVRYAKEWHAFPCCVEAA